MNIKNRIFALIVLDMILPTNFIYNEIFNRSPSDNWVILELGEWLEYGFRFRLGIEDTYWWMWIFIIIAYLVLTYKTEGFDDELKGNNGGP